MNIALDTKTGEFFKCVKGLEYGCGFYTNISKKTMLNKIKNNLKDTLVIIHRAKRDKDIASGGDKLVKYLKEKHEDFYSVGIIEKKIEAHLIMSDNESMCYQAINYKMQMKGNKAEYIESKTYYNPNGEKINDTKFYFNMVKLYKACKDMVARNLDNSEDAPEVAKFISQVEQHFSNMTNEQAEDYVNFVDVIAGQRLEDEKFNLRDKYYEYVERARNLQKCVVVNNKAKE